MPTLGIALIAALAGWAVAPVAAQQPAGVTASIEEPRDGATVSGEAVVRGWIIDTRASADTGIRASGGVQVWLDRRGRSPTGMLLGPAAYGTERPDVAQRQGGQFRQSGFALLWNTCLVAPGRHSLQVFAESATTGAVEFGAEIDVDVGPCPTAARPPTVVGRQTLRLNPMWNEILRRATELRGLAPTREIYRAPLTRDTFQERYETEFAQYFQSGAVDTSRLLLLAFGLLDPGTNLAAELQRLYETLPLGVFDVDHDILFVQRDPPESPLARVTVAHEITHALQHHHYDLASLLPTQRAAVANTPRRTPDATAAIRALVEGDAVLVQRMYQATTVQDPAELSRLEQEEQNAARGLDFSGPPYVMTQTTYFPYLYGPRFIFGVLGQGPLTTFGEYGPAIGRLFRRPPTSTSQILHPERYRDQVEPIPVRLPALDPVLGSSWLPLGEGVLGEFNHRLILENWLRATPDPEWADRASSGWTGDRSAVYRRAAPGDDRLQDTAVVLKTRWATSEDAQAWVEAYATVVPMLYDELAPRQPGGPEL